MYGENWKKNIIIRTIIIIIIIEILIYKKKKKKKTRMNWKKKLREGKTECEIDAKGVVIEHLIFQT